MKTTIKLGQAVTRGAVLLALIALSSGGILRANENGSPSKPPLKTCEKCAVSGHKQAKKEKTKERAQAKAHKAKDNRNISPALDTRPGGLAFAGW